jgi:phytoene dehydrogenase-like protein
MYLNPRSFRGAALTARPGPPGGNAAWSTAGLAVQVIEGAPAIGGGCRTQELTLPGFRHDICSAVLTAADLEAHNPNYVGGDIAVGTQTLRQTVFRPVPRWNPYRTPVRGLYLCSSATPPMPGVHGRCGELAALTALRDVFGIRNAPDISPARLAAPARLN